MPCQPSAGVIGERRDLAQLRDTTQSGGVVGDEQPDENVTADDLRLGLREPRRRLLRGGVILRLAAIPGPCDLRRSARTLAANGAGRVAAVRRCGDTTTARNT